jgi:hypothetical protein
MRGGDPCLRGDLSDLCATRPNIHALGKVEPFTKDASPRSAWSAGSRQGIQRVRDRVLNPE